MTAESSASISSETADSGGAEAPFEARYRAAIAAATARDDQLAAFAHDLRNPLNTLAVSAEVLKRAAPGSPEARSAVAIIGRQVQRMGELISRYLPAGGSLPPSLAVSSLAAPSEAAPDHSRTPRTAGRVVVIGADADTAIGLRSMLEAGGHPVAVGGDVSSGLPMLLQDQPAVAIVDIGELGPAGCDLARRCRAAGYRGRLIALSAAGEAADVQRLLAAGFEAHLVKPVGAEPLARLLLPG